MSVQIIPRKYLDEVDPMEFANKGQDVAPTLGAVGAGPKDADTGSAVPHGTQPGVPIVLCGWTVLLLQLSRSSCRHGQLWAPGCQARALQDLLLLSCMVASNSWHCCADLFWRHAKTPGRLPDMAARLWQDLNMLHWASCRSACR